MIEKIREALDQRQPLSWEDMSQIYHDDVAMEYLKGHLGWDSKEAVRPYVVLAYRSHKDRLYKWWEHLNQLEEKEKMWFCLHIYGSLERSCGLYFPYSDFLFKCLRQAYVLGVSLKHIISLHVEPGIIKWAAVQERLDLHKPETWLGAFHTHAVYQQVNYRDKALQMIDDFCTEKVWTFP